MPNPTEITLAKLLTQGLVSPETIANHFQLQEPLRAAFINTVDRAHLEVVLDPDFTHLEINLLARVIENINKVPAAKRSELSVLEFMSETGSRQETNSFRSNDSFVQAIHQNEIPDSLSGLITPSILLASSLIDTLKSGHKRIDKKTATSLSKSAIANSRTILQQTLLTGANHLIEGTGLSGGVGAALGLIKEYEYHQNNTSLEQRFANTMATAENSYMELHRMYASVAQHYQQALTQLEQQDLKGSAQYQAQVEEWLSIERYFNTKIREQQSEIALVGSMAQELQSKRRINRAGDALNTALTFTVFAGPPGIIASGIIKGIASAGTTLGEMSISDTAKLNHGVTDSNSLLLVTDKDSIEDAETVLISAVNPVIALSGPILKPTTFLNVNIDHFSHTDAGLAKKMVDKTQARTSCSFAFSKSLPTPPDTQPCDPQKNFSNDPAVKAEGKAHLKALINAQATLNHQAQYIQLLGKTLQESQKPHPAVINFHEITQAMVDLHQAIEEKKNIIMNNMGEEYCSKPSEGEQLLTQLQAQQDVFEMHLTELNALKESLKATPFAAIGQYQQAKTEVTREQYRQQIHDDFKDMPNLRLNWLYELKFNLDAIEKLGTTCKELGKGRHIQNFAEALSEVDSQLAVLKSMLDSPETKHVVVGEMILMKDCEAKLQQLSQLGKELDQQRIDYLRTQTGQVVSTQEHYEELARYREHIDGDDILSDQEALMPNLVRELQQPTVIDLSLMNQTDAIVTPNRMFFGLSKHEDIKKAVADKVDQLTQNPLTDTVQVMPLRAIDEAVLSSCAGDYGQFKSVIEGLKTEIQWVNKFQEACGQHDPPLTVANTDHLIEFYQKQIDSLQKICQNKDQFLGRTPESASSTLASFAAFKTNLTNVLHESVTHDAEKELAKAELALQTLKAGRKELELPAAPAVNSHATQAFKQRMNAIRETGQPAETPSQQVENPAQFNPLL